MSIDSVTFEANTSLALRRELNALRVALDAKEDARAALQRRVERLERAMNAILMAHAENGLRIEKLIREA